MRVVILNQYYFPDVAATAQLATDLGEHLARAGHQVVAVASARSYAAGGERLPLEEEHAGVRILRVPATAFGRRSKLARVADYGSFLAGATARLFGGRPDVVIALSTPPFVAALGVLAQRLAATRVVFWVMDVYPEVAVQLGALDGRGLVARLLSGLARLLLSRADAVVALDDAMRARLIAQGAAPERVTVIDNWVDGEDIRPLPLDGHPLRASLGLGDRFTVSYSGNMGLGHDFDTIVGAMGRLRFEAVHWLFIGEGPQRDALERAASQAGVAHTFLPYQPRRALPESLTAAHLSLVTLRDNLAGLLVPSKLYGCLAAGVPVLYVGPTEGRVAEVVAQGAGVSLRNGDVDGLARAIVRLRDDPDARAQMATRARRVYEDRFTRAIALEHHRRLVERVAAC